MHYGVAAPGPSPEDPHVPGRRPREPGPLRGIPAPHRRAPSPGHRDHELSPGVGARAAELPEPAPGGIPMEQSVRLPRSSARRAGAESVSAELVPEAAWAGRLAQGIVQLPDRPVREP